MLGYILYRLGQFVSLILPLQVAYKVATCLSTIQYYLAIRDRRAVISNLGTILNVDDNRLLTKKTKAVFVNFGKYLVDFFRFSKLNRKAIDDFVKVEGTALLDKALKGGKGVITVTAHIGNWELAGAITSLLGYPINAIALTHRNKKVNALFVKQRTARGLKVIPVGVAVRKSLENLKKNEMLALLGDRDFTLRGIPMNFLGKQVLMPKGPATLSLKSGAPIVLGFAVRQKDDTYILRFEKPKDYKPTGRTDEDLKTITRNFVDVIERYIKRYPEQWFMFKKFWAEDANAI